MKINLFIEKEAGKNTVVMKELWRVGKEDRRKLCCDISRGQEFVLSEGASNPDEDLMRKQRCLCAKDTMTVAVTLLC